MILNRYPPPPRTIRCLLISTEIHILGPKSYATDQRISTVPADLNTPGGCFLPQTPLFSLGKHSYCSCLVVFPMKKNTHLAFVGDFP